MMRRAGNLLLAFVLVAVCHVPLCCQLMMIHWPCETALRESTPAEPVCSCCASRQSPASATAPEAPSAPGQPCTNCSTLHLTDRLTAPHVDVAGFDLLLPVPEPAIQAGTLHPRLTPPLPTVCTSRPPPEVPPWLAHGVILI